MKSNPLYTDMRLTELAEVKRGQPSWTIEEYARNSGDKGKLTALDLQVSLFAQGGVRWGKPGHTLVDAEMDEGCPSHPLPPLQLPGPHHGILNLNTS